VLSEALGSAEYNSPVTETRVGSYLFPDGVTRPVFQDENDGWQYVLDEYGRRVYSMWLFSEAAWQTCTEPDKMLQFLLQGGGASTRKLRLFACACCRRILRFQTDDASRAAVEAAEEYADGLIPIQELSARAAGDASWAATMVEVTPKKVATLAERYLASWEASVQPLAVQGAAKATVLSQQAELFRDVFGNPFRSAVIQPRGWTPAVVGLAQTIYEQRAFQRMSELAKALEQAGCTDSDIPSYCRQPGQHVRGCYVVDFILGKE
jgi:hypothetical protein